MGSQKEEEKKDHQQLGGSSSSSSSSSIGIILRYADWVDIVLMLMGALGAIGDGMSTNVLLLFASRIMNSLGYSNNKQNGVHTSMAEVEKVSI